MENLEGKPEEGGIGGQAPQAMKEYYDKEEKMRKSMKEEIMKYYKSKQKPWTYHCKKCDKEVLEPDFECMNPRCFESKYYITKEDLKQKIYDAVHFIGHFTLTFFSVPDPQANDIDLEFKGASPDNTVNEYLFYLDPVLDPIRTRAVNHSWYAAMDFDWLMEGFKKDSEQYGVIQNYIKAFKDKDKPEIRIILEEDAIKKEEVDGKSNS